MEARDKGAVVGPVRATGFFTEAEAARRNGRVPHFYRAGDDRVIYAEFYR